MWGQKVKLLEHNLYCIYATNVLVLVWGSTSSPWSKAATVWQNLQGGAAVSFQKNGFIHQRPLPALGPALGAS